MTTRRLIAVVAIGIVIAALAAFVGFNVYLLKFSPYAPILAGTRQVGYARNLGRMIENRSEFVPPADGRVTDAQVAQFIAVETAVERAVSASFAGAVRELEQRAEAPGGLTINSALKIIGGLALLEAKQAQVRAINAAHWSQEEFEWVRRAVYSSARLEWSQLDLAALGSFTDMQERIRIKRMAPRDADARPDLMTGEGKARLERWRAHAFFGL